MPRGKKSEKPTIAETAKYLRQHADVLMKMPASEQYIGGRDSVMFSALNQIADALETLYRFSRTGRL